jgi:transglutaminase-like putative cysteine protease
VPGVHRQLTIVAESMVDVTPREVLPMGLSEDAWSQLDAQLANGDFWEMLAPSQFAHWTALIEELAREVQLPTAEGARLRDPLELVAGVNTHVYNAIAYVPKSTRVDSPVDDALRNRQGVCQDYSHIMIALLRRMGIPCRYVSGYLFHKAGVPPTRGVFKGDASSELTVAVRVAPSDKPPPPETEMESEDWSEVLQADSAEVDRAAAEQQQQ